MLILLLAAHADTGELKNMVTAPASCVEGEVIDVEVGSSCPSGSTVTWTDDTESTDFAATTGTSTTWTCPAIECSTQTYHLYALCEDAEGHQFWGDAKVEVVCEEEQGKETTGLCATAPGTALGALTIALASLAARRRGSDTDN